MTRLSRALRVLCTMLLLVGVAFGAAWPAVEVRLVAGLEVPREDAPEPGPCVAGEGRVAEAEGEGEDESEGRSERSPAVDLRTRWLARRDATAVAFAGRATRHDAISLVGARSSRGPPVA
jgi:hypothetical protein